MVISSLAYSCFNASPHIRALGFVCKKRALIIDQYSLNVLLFLPIERFLELFERSHYAQLYLFSKIT